MKKSCHNKNYVILKKNEIIWISVREIGHEEKLHMLSAQK